MREFFRGWRRRIGVVTLVVACVFATGWVRSNVIADFLVRHTRSPSFIEVQSSHGYIIWWSSSKSYFSPDTSSLAWIKMPIADVEFYLDSNENKTQWSLKGLGIGFGKITLENGFDSIVWYIPYWSVVIPLTLVSAYLLLRKSRPAKTTEPTSAIGI